MEKKHIKTGAKPLYYHFSTIMEVSSSLSALIKLGEEYAVSEHYVDKGQLKIYTRSVASPEEFFVETEKVIDMLKEGFEFQAQLGYVVHLLKIYLLL